jgi:hypothetical protein
LPTVIAPLRAGPEFAAAEKLSVPLSVVPDPAPIVSQGALDALFHAQPVPAVTLTDPLVAAAPMLAPVGDSAYVQPPLAATWKPATVAALPLWTRALSDVDVVPRGSVP